MRQPLTRSIDICVARTYLLLDSESASSTTLPGVLLFFCAHMVVENIKNSDSDNCGIASELLDGFGQEANHTMHDVTTRHS